MQTWRNNNHTTRLQSWSKGIKTCEEAWQLHLNVPSDRKRSHLRTRDIRRQMGRERRTPGGYKGACNSHLVDNRGETVKNTTEHVNVQVTGGNYLNVTSLAGSSQIDSFCCICHLLQPRQLCACCSPPPQVPCCVWAVSLKQVQEQEPDQLRGQWHK